MKPKKEIANLIRNILQELPNEIQHLYHALQILVWNCLVPFVLVVLGLGCCVILGIKIYRRIYPLTAQELLDEAQSLLKKQEENPLTEEQQHLSYQSYNIIISKKSSSSRQRAYTLLHQCIQTYPTFIQSYHTLASEYLYGEKGDLEAIQKCLEICKKGLKVKEEKGLRLLELEAKALLIAKQKEKSDDSIRHMMNVGLDLGI
mmetsp:Transcript_14380/g.19198  ORF Transcript_14380/g.19198 Transcript_14380/m.19198 type:complete len:203 (-) Transcript_14380:434-1042(-)